MFWALLVILFLKDGTALPLARPETFATEQSCRDAAAKVAELVRKDPPAELAGLGFKCEGPISNPVTAKGA